MINKKKRGMNDVMVVVLLVLLVTSIIAAIFIWNKQIFSSLTSNSNTCSELSFSTGDFCYEEQTIGEEIRTRLSFNIRNEIETKNIEGLLVFVDDKYGNTQTISSLSSIQISGFEIASLTTDSFSNNGKISNIRVTPQIIENKKIILCEEKQVIIKWTTIKEC
jgi:hypothetical protein